MPHLAPMNWIFALFIFWFILFMLASIMWWHQLPNYPMQKSSHLFIFPQWKW